MFWISQRMSDSYSKNIDINYNQRYLIKQQRHKSFNFHKKYILFIHKIREFSFFVEAALVKVLRRGTYAFHLVFIWVLNSSFFFEIFEFEGSLADFFLENYLMLNSFYFFFNYSHLVLLPSYSYFKSLSILLYFLNPSPYLFYPSISVILISTDSYSVETRCSDGL